MLVDGGDVCCFGLVVWEYRARVETTFARWILWIGHLVDVGVVLERLRDNIWSDVWSMELADIADRTSRNLDLA